MFGALCFKSPRNNLPALPQVAYVRHTRAQPHPTIVRLADLITSAVLGL